MLTSRRDFQVAPKAAFGTEFEARAFVVVNFALDSLGGTYMYHLSGDPVDRCTTLYTRADRQQDQRCALQCVHEDKGLRNYRVAHILYIVHVLRTDKQPPSLVALRVRLTQLVTLSSQSVRFAP